MRLIIVLSRTLFVGGVTNQVTEDKLRQLFGQFGSVQSIIINPEKRCAFLKMYTREGAINAREGMESYPFIDTTIRVFRSYDFANLRRNMALASDPEIARTMPQASP